MIAGASLMVIILLFGSSFVNSKKYYIGMTKTGIEILKGRFAPIGSAKLAVLQGVEMPTSIQEAYTKADIYPMIYNYYNDRATEMMTATAIPDLEGAKFYIGKAMNFALTKEVRKATLDQLTDIDFSILMMQASALLHGTDGAKLTSAVDFLTRASKMAVDPERVTLAKNKLNTAKALLEKISKK